MEHELVAEYNVHARGFLGSCVCMEPDFEDGWSGYSTFFSDTLDGVEDQFLDHVREEGELV